MTDAGLLAHFAAAFPKGNRPHPHRRDPAVLDSFYEGLPDGFGRLPKLYEQFLLTYKWGTGQFDQVYLQVGFGTLNEMRFMENHGGETFESHIQAVRIDKGMSELLSANGYFQFAKGAGQSYDAVCFATKERRGQDCPVVIIDHEEILCNNRIRVRRQFAPSFRELVERTCTYSKLKMSSE